MPIDQFEKLNLGKIEKKHIRDVIFDLMVTM
jgi:hypothetical protein